MNSFGSCAGPWRESVGRAFCTAISFFPQQLQCVDRCALRRSEGRQRRFPHDFCALGVFVCVLHPKFFIMTSKGVVKDGRYTRRKKTHPKDGWIVGHLWRLVVSLGLFLDSEILDIASSKNDILIYVLRSWNLLFRSTFGPK